MFIFLLLLLLESNLWVWKFRSVGGRVCVSDGFAYEMN